MQKTAPPPSRLEDERDDKSQRAVQSVEVGGRLLLALADSGGALSLKDLAVLANMTPSRAHPYLVSYVRLGLVEQDTTGRYDLGPAALRVGLACLQRLDPLKAADPVIRSLAAQTGHAVALAVWGNFGPTVVRLIEAREPLHVSLRIGSVLSLFDTATGRAFASVLPLEKLRQALAGPLGEVVPPEVFLRREVELDQIRTEARRHGVNRTVGTPIPGVNAFSAPVLDLQGDPVLAVTVTGHQNRLPSDWNSPVVQSLRMAVNELQLRIGGKAQK
jgi:DNA-binding IclR family transcriptional regulator